MRLRVVVAVARSTFREFWRSPDALFWTYGFPLVMALALGLAFQPGPPPQVPVAVVADADAAALLAAEPRLLVEPLAAEAADRALARGRVAASLRRQDGGLVLRADPTRPDAEIAVLLVERALRAAPPAPAIAPLRREVEDRPGSRYIDFLIPGLIGLNLLGAGMWGIGFNLVQMRVGKLLRRLAVTPMRRSEFLFGYLLGRCLLVVPESAALVGFGALLWGVPFRGSLLAGLLLVAAGGLAFAGLGVLVASRARTLEGVGGLMNLVQLPMWLLCGTWFDTSRFTGALRWFADLLPLTHVNRALRDVMLEPQGLLDAAPTIAGLCAFAAVCLALALRWFRWQ